MATVTLSDARQALVRTRVLDGVADVLRRGEELTFANVAAAASVPERTVYRHFPSREALLAAVYDWANERIGFHERPTDAEGMAQLVRRMFPAFDAIAPVIRELLIAPEGKLARLAHNEGRKRAALALVQNEAPGLDRTSARRVAAIFQLLASAPAWQTISEYWGIDGTEAAEASVLAMELMLDGIHARERRRRRARKTPGKAARRAEEERQ